MKFRKRNLLSKANGAAIDPTELLRPILKNALTRQVKAGDIIFYQGESPESATVLKKGIVKVYKIAASGEEQVINFQLPGEVFPTVWVFGKSPIVLYFYQALTDCEIYLFSREEFLKYVNSSTKILQAFLDYYINNYVALVMRVTALEQSKAREKITYTMYYLVQRYGKRLTNNRVQIKLELTHQDIANLIGLTRETTAVQMSRLKNDGVIHYAKQRYTVNIQKLLEIMDEESFKDLNLG